MNWVTVSIPGLELPEMGDVQGPDKAGYRERLALSTGLPGMNSAVLSMNGSVVCEAYVLGLRVPLADVEAKAMDAYGMSLAALARKEGMPVPSSIANEKNDRFDMDGFRLGDIRPAGTGNVFAVNVGEGYRLLVELCTDGVIRLADPGMEEATGPVPRNLGAMIDRDPAILRGLIRHDCMYDGTSFPEAHQNATKDLLMILEALTGDRTLKIHPICLDKGRTLVFRTVSGFVMPDVMFTSRDGSGVIPIMAALEELEDSVVCDWSLTILADLAFIPWQGWSICAELGFLTPFLTAGEEESRNVGLRFFEILSKSYPTDFLKPGELLQRCVLRAFREKRLDARETVERLELLRKHYDGGTSVTDGWLKAGPFVKLKLRAVAGRQIKGKE